MRSLTNCTSAVHFSRSKNAVNLFLTALVILLGSPRAFATTGFTYTGRITDADDKAITSNDVRFTITIYDSQKKCWLYTEQRQVDMSSSSGMFSLEIGSSDSSLIGGTASFNGSTTGPQNLSDVFDNSKTFTGLGTANSCTGTFTPNASDPIEGRYMGILFSVNGGANQALPILAINPVPAAMQAHNAAMVTGYDKNHLLHIDTSIASPTNSDINATQLAEFFRLVNNPNTAYLSAVPSMTGDVSGTVSANTVNKIKGIAVTAPTTGDVGKLLSYDGTNLVWATGGAGSGITSLNGLSGATQSFVAGSSGTDFTISSSGSGHTFNLPTASASNRGLLSTTDWSAFNAKQSSSLAAAQVWIGNSSGAAQAQTISGDATLTSAGVLTVDKTTSGAASKILQLDAGSIATAKGVDILGAGSGSVQLRYPSTSNNTTLNFPSGSGSANQFLQTDGSGNLTWASPSASLPTLTAGQIWVGNSSGGPQGFALSGDIASVTNTGLVTLTTAASGANKLPLAGGTMSGDISAQNINIAAGKYLGLGSGTTAGTVAGQVWYDSGTIKYYDGSTTKSLGVAGAGITNLNGLTAGTQSFVIDAAGTAPAMVSSGSAHTLSIPMASAASVTAGLLSNADYTSIMSKQSTALADGKMWVGNASNVAQAFTLSGDIFSVSNTGLVTVNKTTTGTANTILALDGSGVATANGLALKNTGTVTLSAGTTSATYGLKLPTTSPTANQLIQVDATGQLTWASTTPVGNAAALTNGKFWMGNASNIAAEVTMSGDATITNAGLLTLKNTGTVGTYFKVTTDAQGRVASGSGLLSGDVTTALGYTPTSSASGFVNGGNAFGGNASIGLTDAKQLTILTSNTAALTIAANGLLQPANDIRLPSGNSVMFGSSSYAYINGSSGGSSYLNFGTSGATAMTIDVNGKVGIGGSPNYSLDVSSRNDAIRLPTGDNSTRPANATGLVRYNSSSNAVEFNNGSAWNSLVSIPSTTLGAGTTVIAAGNGNISAGSGGTSTAGGGQIYGSAYDTSATTTAIDFNYGNLQTTSYDCAATITLSNMQSGGSYSLTVTGSGTNKCVFKEPSGSAFADGSYSPSNSTRTASSHTVYTFIKIGSRVYVSWITGFSTTQ